MYVYYISVHVALRFVVTSFHVLRRFPSLLVHPNLLRYFNLHISFLFATKGLGNTLSLAAL